MEIIGWNTLSCTRTLKMDHRSRIFHEFTEISNWNPLLSYHESKGFQHKCSILSSQIRKEGNKLYTQKDHDDKIHSSILLLYNKSVALAIENSEEQALAYSNRSALLMHLHKYKKSLVDIKRAFKITGSLDLKKKLKARKQECLAKIKNEEKNDEIKNFDYERKPNAACIRDSAFMAPVVMEQVKECGGSLSEQDIRNNLNLPKTGTLDGIQDKFNKLKLPELESRNKTIPNFSECLSLVYNKKFGRHVIASRDIKPGEILVIEKNFVIPDIDNIYTVCSHCLNFAWNGISCPTCVYAIYCSEKCKIKAWKEYHDIECSLLPPFFSDAIVTPDFKCEIAALRLFVTFAKKEGLQRILDEAKSIDNDESSHINGFLTNGKFDNAKFRAFYNLLHHEQAIQKNYYYGGFATLLLLKYTPILNDYKMFNNFKNIETLVQIKRLLSNFKATIDTNAKPFIVSTCVCTNLQNCSHSKLLGLTVAPCSSLFNHSCCANIGKFCCKNGVTMLFSVRPIKKNEQIFTNYGYVVGREPKLKRQSELKKFYYFTCNCEACEKNWLENSGKNHQELDKNIVAKVLNKFRIYSESLKSKSLDYPSLALGIKMIELSFKNFNNFDAFVFSGDSMMYLCKIIYKLYGIEIKIPNSC